MLANLLSVPANRADWDAYSRSHRTSHDAIRTAIKTQFETDLPEYVLDPIEPADFAGFLERNQQAHYEANAVADVFSVNLGGVDPSDEAQLRQWIWLHYTAHRNLEQRLGIGS